MKKINHLLELASKLPSGLDDANAAEKLLVERDELLEALGAGDYDGALTEAADAAYYVVKHLDWVANCFGLLIEDVIDLGIAKYTLRASPGNPKDDAAERVVVVDVFRGMS